MKEKNKLTNLFSADRGAPKGANYPAAFEKKAFEKGKKFKNLFKNLTVSSIAGKTKQATKLGKVASVARLARSATPIGLGIGAANIVYKVATRSPEEKARTKKLKTRLSKTSTKDYHADLLKMSNGGEMLKNPKKADLDKDGKLSSYEKKRGKAIEANMKAKKGKMMYANEGKMMTFKEFVKQKSGAAVSDKELGDLKTAYMKKLSGAAVSDAEMKKFKKMIPAKKGKMMYASMGMEAKSTKGYGAARSSGMGLQDEQLVPGKSLDYYKDLM
mgnify:CR=1 FL=1